MRPRPGGVGGARAHGLSHGSHRLTPGLRTARLSLDPLRVVDALEMIEVLSAPDLYRFTGDEPPSLAELQRRYRLQVTGASADGRQTWHNWVVRTRDPVEAVGYVQATVVDERRRAEVAWVVGVPWQGRGYATEAAIAMVEWLVASGVEVVTAHVHPDHARSARVAGRVGLRPTSTIDDGERVWRLEPGRRSSTG